MANNSNREKEVIAELSARLALAERKAAELATLRDLEAFDYNSSLESLMEMFGEEAVRRELRNIKYGSLKVLKRSVRAYKDLKESLVSRLDSKFEKKMFSAYRGLKRDDESVINSMGYETFAEQRRSLEGINSPRINDVKEIVTRVGTNGYTMAAGVFYVPNKEREPNVDSPHLDRIFSFVVVPPISLSVNSLTKRCYLFKVPIYYKARYLADSGNILKRLEILYKHEHTTEQYDPYKLKDYLRSLIDSGYSEFTRVLIDGINCIPELAAEYINERNEKLIRLVGG